MYRNWFEARYGALLCAAAWLAGPAIRLAAAPQPQPVAGARAPQASPLTVHNPFVKPQPAQQQPAQQAPLPQMPLAPSATARPAGTQPIPVPSKQLDKCTPIPIVGATVDAEAP